MSRDGAGFESRFASMSANDRVQVLLGLWQQIGIEENCRIRYANDGPQRSLRHFAMAVRLSKLHESLKHPTIGGGK